MIVQTNPFILLCTKSTDELNFEDLNNPEFVHLKPHRQNEILTSRKALSELFNHQNISITPAELFKQSSACNQQIGQHLDYIFSLSHTTNLGAAILAKKIELSGIGIDLEWQDRKINPKVVTKIRSSKQEYLPTDLLHEWCAKEAIYKLLSGIYSRKSIPNKLISFKEIALFEQNFKFGEIFGHWEIKEILVNKRPSILAYAYSHK